MFPLATNTVILLIVLLESLCAGLAMGWIYITFILDFGESTSPSLASDNVTLTFI
jgi:hypothetical protein